MEIEIPDLQDLKFVEACPSCARRFNDEPPTGCQFCTKGVRLTPVGNRLIKFLQAIGVPVMNHGGWVNLDGD